MLPDYVWPDPEDRAEDLAPVAEELARRIRHDDPTRLCLQLLMRYDVWELMGIICLLAAQVDTSVPHEVRVGWARYRDALEQAALIPIDDVPWAGEEDSAAINTTVRRMWQQNVPNERIADETGLSLAAVKGRKVRLRQQDREAAGAVA